MRRILLIVIIASSFVNSAEITGQGFIKTNYGKVFTCSGERVYLTSDSDASHYLSGLSLSYSQLSYLKTAKKIIRGEKFIKEAEVELLQEYNSIEKEKDIIEKQVKEGKILTTTCDAQGNFVFNDLPIGDYLIATTVNWINKGERQEEYLTESADIKKDDLKVKVLLHRIVNIY